MKTLTLMDWKEKYEKTLKKRNKSEHTVTAYLFSINKFIDYCNEEEITPDDLNTEIFEEFLYSLDLEAITANCHITRLKVFFAFMYDQGGISTKFYKKVKFYKEEEKVLNFFGQKEIDDIKVKLKDLLTQRKISMRDYTIVLFMIGTGLRISEIYDLKKSNVDIHTKRVNVILGKGKKNRSLYMFEETAKLLEDYYDDYYYFQEQSEYVFTNMNGQKMKHNTLNKRFNAISKLLGVGVKLYPHKLRHTFVTLLVRRNIPIPVIARWAGHSSIKTTMRYVHVCAEDIREYAEDIKI